jgi:intein-encoded DNA endonuclease-like protein
MKKTHKFEKKIKEEICEEYMIGKSGPFLANKYNCSPPTIYYILKNNNIEIRKQTNLQRKYKKINEEFFDIINNQNKAYFLGFLFADGHNSAKENKIRLSLNKVDKEILVKIRDLISPEQPLHFGKTNNIVTLQISNKHLSKQLKTYGIVGKKAFKIRFPFGKVNDYKSHFVRGYFDGDGSIYPINKSRTGFKITSNYNFLNDLNSVFSEEIKLNFPIYKNPPSYELKTSAKDKVYKFLNWIYQDADLYLERKYKRYQEFLEWYNSEG